MATSLLGTSIGVFRLPTDPLFYADLTLRNVVAGSRYRITRTDTGAELATGLVSGSGLVDQVISGVACYANPQGVNVVIRQGTSAPKYLAYEAQAQIEKSGGLAFIAQVADPIA
jgi:hypothetical protein